MGEYITNPAFWTATGTWAMVLVLLGSLYYASRQVKEASELRTQQMRPYVVVSLDVEQRSLFMLTVENIGLTPAFDVAIEFEPSPRSRFERIEGVLREPIPMLPPRKRFRFAWDVGKDLFADDYPHPLKYVARTTYKDHQRRSHGPEEYILDFKVYEGQSVELKGLHELVESIQELRKELGKWTDGTAGLRVHHVDAVRQSRRRDRPIHLGRTKRALEEGGILGAIRYWIDLWGRRYGLRVR